MKHVYTLVLFISAFWTGTLSSQQVFDHSFSLAWSETDPLKFKGAGSYSPDQRLPVYMYRFRINGPSDVAASVQPSSTTNFSITGYKPKLDLPRSYDISAVTEQDRGVWYAKVALMPIVSSGGDNAQKIIDGKFSISVTPKNQYTNRSGPDFKTSSMLASGTIHRIAVSTSGIFKIDYNFIKDKIKIDPATIAPQDFMIFGNGGGRLPQPNNAPRIDDVEEVHTMGVGIEDGRIDQGDYFLWYAEGPDKWSYDPKDRLYHMEKNIYDELNHYYVIINGTDRTPVSNAVNAANGTYESNNSLSFQRLEEEKINLLGRYRSPGSGQEWYGDELAVVDQIDYSHKFDLSHMLPTDTLFYKFRFAARAGTSTRFYVYFDQHEASRTVGGVDLPEYEASFASSGILQGSFKTPDPVDQIRIRYPDANGINRRAWIDYIEINFWKQNQYTSGKPLYVRDTRAPFQGIPTYTITGAPDGVIVWNITDPLQPVNQQFSKTDRIRFATGHSNLSEPESFVVFNPATDALVPAYEMPIQNQNIHSTQSAELAIIYYDDFGSAATKLAAHRRDHSGLNVVTIPVSQIFEEFSGGSKDPTAIRDFARMLYLRDPSFRYLLLMGDATYDYLKRTPELPYHNFIPAWETEESLHPITSFPSDDYFALLDAEEGDNLIGALDIAVGRFPVATAEEANALVDKTIYYDTDPSTLNDWRQRIVMVADDEDGNTHLNQADALANETSQMQPELNIQKIYLDAYPQESTPGGDRYPGANADIDLNMKKGALTFTYMGHGGQNGWTQERVLSINQAQSYDNKDNMPLFITATCSFAGYDEPSFKTAGEHLLTNPDGGAIALMTTVRAVYSGANDRLTGSVMDIIYSPDHIAKDLGIAEILRRAKNKGNDTLEINARKFTLLGDPSMKLAFPEYHVSITAINGQPVQQATPDTLSALEKASVSGNVIDDNGEVLTNFNGEISLTVFDKVQIRKTLANDDGSHERNFTTQNRQLFKGAASVVNGEWSIEFVLPKDLDFTYGPGKMSFYAQNGETDAAGHFTSFLIGGVSSEGLSDDQPPVIELFMNDENFVSGGITDAHPDIYIQLSDDNGINVSGTGVGHDIEAVLDNDDKNSFILNDFYKAAVDDYKRGEVRYPLSGLAPGRHTLKVTAWDLANNPAEAYIEFLVLDDEGAVLQHVLNYPNPFTTNTWFQFEHNRPGVEMNLQVQIYTINGRLVKTIERETYFSDGYRVADIEWNGLDDSGGQLAKGIYVYRIRAAFNTNGQKEIVESKAEKLVILR